MAMTTSSNAGPNINMTPLIDVLLVLLIIFMVITPLAPKGLSATIPQPSAQKTVQPEGTIVIRVMQGELRINQELVTEETLGPRLAEIFKTRAERVAFVKGEGDLEFQDVARVIDIAKSAGVEYVGLMS